MKRMDLTGVLAATVFLLCSAIHGRSAAADRVVVGYNDYPPYTWSHDGGGGIVVDLVRAAFARAGIEVVLHVCAWEQCESELDGGELFAAIPYRANPERRRHYDFSDPLVDSRNRFFYLRSDKGQAMRWRGLRDFQPYRMGGSRGHWYVPAFEKAGLRILFADGEHANFDNLLRGDIDFFLTDELVGRRVLHDEFAESETARVGMLERPESEAPLRLMISRAYPHHEALRKRFHHGLMLLVHDGAYDDILSRHGLGKAFATQPEPSNSRRLHAGGHAASDVH